MPPQLRYGRDIKQHCALSIIIIIIIIKNELIIVTLHTKVLQGHFTQINTKTLQMLRNIIRLLEQ